MVDRLRCYLFHRPRCRQGRNMLLRLHTLKGTFIVMHQYAVPAENVPATRHLRRLEFFLKANCTAKLLLRVINNLPYFVPFVLFDAFKRGKILKLLQCELRSIDGESKPAHKAILAIFCAISHLN